MDSGPSEVGGSQANPVTSRLGRDRQAKSKESSEAHDDGFQEKLLAMHMRPVPKPTQVVKARSLR